MSEPAEGEDELVGQDEWLMITSGTNRDYWEATAHKYKAENARLREALKRLLDHSERNTCQHEETHRGGFLWEICDGCGAKWADDMGGKTEWKDPPEWVAARAALEPKEQRERREKALAELAEMDADLLDPERHHYLTYGLREEDMP